MSEPNFLENAIDGKEASGFNYFEPFDIGPRPDWLIEKARKADIVLDLAGSPFQASMIQDVTHTPFFTISFAGSQSGKSRGHLIDAIIAITGHIPISLCHDKGMDTGVKRLVTPENIKRFGMRKDGTCGNIIGAGKYPQEKIAPKGGSQIWICTFKEARDKMWIPRFKEIIPPYLLDQSRGVGGFSEGKETFFFSNNNTISHITYEQDYRRVEAERAWMIILDEEPPDRRLFISASEHCVYLRICFTPISGLSWAYHDLYLPILNGQNKKSRMFYCSQYDSPYQDRDMVDVKEKIYKPYEVKARVWGQFSDMAGKPYYDSEITDFYLKHYVPRHTLVDIYSMQKIETVRDALKTKMKYEEKFDEGDNVWFIYEPIQKEASYWLAADVAEGSDDPEEAQDSSAAYIRRLPLHGEKEPVLVAAFKTTMRNVEFAWHCLYAAIYYNYALMAPEARGEDAAVFLTTIIDYPFIYKHVVRSDKTHRQKEIRGFDTTASTRKIMFDMIGTWILDHPTDSKLPHYPLLKEMRECIVGKGGRPDHPGRGSTDCLVAFGISEYVYQSARTQIRNNRYFREKEDGRKKNGLFPCILGTLHAKQQETRKCLGTTRGLDQRERRYGKEFYRNSSHHV